MTTYRWASRENLRVSIGIEAQILRPPGLQKCCSRCSTYPASIFSLGLFLDCLCASSEYMGHLSLEDWAVCVTTGWVVSTPSQWCPEWLSQASAKMQRFHPTAQWTWQEQKHSFVLPGSCLPMWSLSSHSGNVFFSLPLYSECSASWLWPSLRASSASTFLHPSSLLAQASAAFSQITLAPLDPHVAANSAFPDLCSSSGWPKSSPYQLSPLSNAFENPENLKDRRNWPSVESTQPPPPTQSQQPCQVAKRPCLNVSSESEIPPTLVIPLQFVLL